MNMLESARLTNGGSMHGNLFNNGLFDFIFFFGVALLLSFYHFVSHRKKHSVKFPVSFFICFFLTMAGVNILDAFVPPSALDAFLFIAWVFLVLGVIRVIVFVPVDYFIQHKKKIHVPRISKDIGLALVYFIAVMVMLKYKAHIDPASLITTSAVLSIVIGLALQDTLGNLFSGVVLQMEKPFHIDDWVSFDKFTGKVVEMSWKSTKLLTREKEMISIPNNVIAKGHILNYSKPDPLHIATFDIGTSYSDPPNLVRAAILETLNEHPQIVAKPDSEVRVHEFADFSIVYRVRFPLTDFAELEKIKSDVRNRLYYRFKRDGITIPFPIRTIEHIGHDPEKVKDREAKCVELAFEKLKKVDVFRPVSISDLKGISGLVKFEEYSAGENIIREGEAGSSMYTIVRGECDIIIGGTKIIATLGPDQFFGEMSLLTGDPRTATVKAKTDVTCLKIGKANIEGILKAHPEATNAIGEILAQRRVELIAKKDEMSKEAVIVDPGFVDQMISKIRSFFNL